MRASLILCLALAGLGADGRCQSRPSLPPLRVIVEKEGLHEITAEDLAAFTEPGLISADHLSLTRDGREIPIQVRGSSNGQLAQGDRLLFYAPRPTGPRSRSDVYVLRVVREPSPARLTMGREDADPSAVDEAIRVVVAEEDRLFEPFACVRQSIIRSREPLPNWYWKRLPAPPEASGDKVPDECMATFLLLLHPEPRRSLPATLVVDLAGPVVDGVPQRLAANVNGHELPLATWDTGLGRRVEYRIPPETLGRQNSVQLRNLSPAASFTEPDNEVARRRRNYLLVDRISVICSTLLAGPSKTGEQFVYHLARAAGNASQSVAFRTLSRDGFLLFNATTLTMGLGRSTRLGSGPETVVCCLGPAGAHRPSAIEPLRLTTAHLPGSGAEYVVITTTRLKTFLEPLVHHREQGGLATVVVEARELYDTFTNGRFDPEAIRLFVRAAHRNWKVKPRYVLLVGDADHDVDWISSKETLPALMVMTDYNGATPTDALFGDVDGDGVPDIPVGRFPARSPEALVAIIQRTIDLETRPEGGTWRRLLRFVAGDARFNPVVDKLLEGTLRNVLTTEIPPGYRLSLTWARPDTPYSWPANGFGNQVIHQLNDGCLAFTYVGHGLPDRLDQIRDGNDRYPILDQQTAARFDAGRKNPVIALIACSTGAYDLPDRDCLAETLLHQDRGAAAVIASSRISHPYPDALFGLALARAFFAANARLGDVLQITRAGMLAEAKGPLALAAQPFLSAALDSSLLVRDHLYLYNLFGDPALRIPLPAERVELALAGPPRRGEPLPVRGRLISPEKGRLVLSLDRPPGRLAPDVRSDPGPAAAMIENHQKANDPVIAELTLDLDGAEWTASLALPADLPPGKYLLDAYVSRESGRDAIGSLPVTVE